jgi:hypothetical protein
MSTEPSYLINMKRLHAIPDDAKADNAKKL